MRAVAGDFGDGRSYVFLGRTNDRVSPGTGVLNDWLFGEVSHPTSRWGKLGGFFP